MRIKLTKAISSAAFFSASLTITTYSYAESINFLTISDIHLNTQQSHIMQIDPKGYNSANDMDFNTFNRLFSTIKNNVGTNRLIAQPKFILYLGDLVAHQPAFNFNREKFVTTNEKAIFTQLQNSFPNTPIINVFGNNDSIEKNYGDYDYKGKSPYTIAMSAGFKNGFLSTGMLCNQQKQDSQTMPCITAQNPKHGFFSAMLAPKLSLIGLNSVMFSPNHNAKSEAINTQITFLATQLSIAKKNDTSILIAMHIPVGNNVYDGSLFWKNEYKQMFLRVLAQYHNQIRGILVGHTHMEEFKVIKLSGKNYGEYFTAGLSTSHGNSPSVKTFNLTDQAGTWTMNNYTAYQIHNNNKNNQLRLSNYYNFVDKYCDKINFDNDINNCLGAITFNEILPRYTANNPNFQHYKASSPASFYVTTQQ